MEFANKKKSRRVVFLMIAGLMLTACATTEKVEKIPAKVTVKLEPRESLLNWYDVTHKSYYGLKGAVKSVEIGPVLLVDDESRPVNEGWLLQFNKQGRLTSKSQVNGNSGLKTTYSYSESGNLKFVSSYQDDKLWRTSSFIYENGKLVKIQFTDAKTSEQLQVKFGKQRVIDGWFEFERLVDSPGLPAYSHFLRNSSLVWSSKGDINNGIGELYYIRTVDGVTSAAVLHKGTTNMQGVGGYRYNYRKDGLLKSVESYNAHKNRLYHRTDYKYNDIALLVSENKKVVDKSPFNQAIDENVGYEYLQVDDKGNWVRRKLTVKSGFLQQSYLESRIINYFE